jgi:hypothetical protein
MAEGFVRVAEPMGDATPPAPPKFVLTAAGAAGFAAANGDGAAGAGAAAAVVLLVLLLAAGVLVLVLVLAGASATAADAPGRGDAEGWSGSPNSVSNLSMMSTGLPSICALSLSTNLFTCTAPSLKGSERPAKVAWKADQYLEHSHAA